MLTLYDPAELALMPRKYRNLPEHELGELTARVFELLDDGRNMKQIVIETREPVAKLESIREAWLDAGGSALVINAEAKSELERFCGPFETVGDLVALVSEKLGVTIEAVVSDDASDAQIEQAIVSVLDQASASPAP